jgi:hypothetical protein
MWVILKVSGFNRIGSVDAATSSLYKLFTAVDSAPSAISMLTWKFSEKLRNIPPRGLASILSNWLNGMYAIFSSPDVISKNLSFTRSIVSMSGGLGREHDQPARVDPDRKSSEASHRTWSNTEFENRTIASHLAGRREYRLGSGHRNFLRGG